MSFEQQDNLSVRVSDWINQKTIAGDYAPGARIREEHIAATLNISPGPIREDLLILQSQRLVDILPRRGAVVTALSTQQVIELYDVIHMKNRMPCWH